ncbi:MAG: zinc ribbon domain-containing protein [Eubacteriales bacterium]
MYCTNCGTEVINSKFCTSCGEKIQNNNSELENTTNANKEPLENKVIQEDLQSNDIEEMKEPKEFKESKESHEPKERIQHVEDMKNQVSHKVEKDRKPVDNRFILVAIMLPVIILIIGIVSIFTPLTSNQAMSTANRIYNLAVILCLLDYSKLQKLGYKSKPLMILLLLSMVPQTVWIILPISFFVRAKILNQINNYAILGMVMYLISGLSEYGINYAFNRMISYL